MYRFNIVVRNPSGKLILIYSLLIIWLTVSLVYRYSHLLTHNNSDHALLNHISTLNDKQRNIQLKEDFHLNIFDFESFENSKWQEGINSGPCVDTKIEVSINGKK